MKRRGDPHLYAIFRVGYMTSCSAFNDARWNLSAKIARMGYLIRR